MMGTLLVKGLNKTAGIIFNTPIISREKIKTKLVNGFSFTTYVDYKPVSLLKGILHIKFIACSTLS